MNTFFLPHRAALLLLACSVAPALAHSADRLLIANATIVTLVEGQEEPFTGYILVDSTGRIAQIGKGDPPPALGAANVFDADGQIAMPGFLSGHSHLRGSVSRGLAADQWVTEWGRVTQWLLTGNKVEPKDLYYYTLHGALDMLRGGVTTVYNYTTGGGVEANAEQLEAEFDAGGHFVFGYTAPAREPGLTHDEMRAQVRAYLDLAKNHPKRDLLLRSSFGSIAMRWTEEETRKEFELLKEFPEFEMDMQLHYLEPPPTVPRTYYERSNFVWLKKYGILGPNLTYAHFIHPTEEILQESVKAGATMSWNPLSNGRLASGLADIPRYLKMGMTVGMGIDGQASADIADPFENMRVGLYGLRFRDQDPRGLQPIDMLRLHTIGTAKAIRVAKDVGTLEVGKLGDILLVDPHWPDTGPVTDLYATLVLACDRMNISNVFVAGNHVMAHGKHTSIDDKAVTQEVLRRVATKTGKPDR
jgi:cytosine/adenosine deaminase-related metal-dependent hydrolase